MATTATTTTYQYPYPLGGDSLSNVATRIKELADRSETVTAQIIAGNITLAPGTIYNASIAATAGITYSKLNLTGAILNADLAGSIAPSKITGTAITAADTGTVTGTIIASSVALGGNPTTSTVSGTTDNTTKIATTGFVQQVATALTVGSIPDGSLTNVKISSVAAIAYSKLNLATSIVNADIATSAAIAYSKLNLAASVTSADLAFGFPVTKTADFTVGATENWIISNKTSSCVVTLPSAATARAIWIKNIAAFTVVSASSNVKPIGTNTAGTAILPATAGTWCTLVSDGTNWVVMQSGPGLFS